MTKNIHIIIIIVLSFCIVNFQDASAAKRKVFILNSYHSSYPWTSDCLKGLHDNLNPDYEQVHIELDTKRIPKKEFKVRADRAMKLIFEERPDIVVVMDDNALKMLGERISNEGIPQVFLGINQNPRLYFTKKNIPTNVTGVLERPLLKRSLVMLNKLSGPGKYLLMMDVGTTSMAIIKTQMDGRKEAEYGPCSIDVFTSNHFTKWKEEVRNLDVNEYKGIIICNYTAMKDASGKHAPMTTVAKWTSANSKVPIFAFWRYSVGKGKAMGGLIMSGYHQGKTAAEMANKILSGGPIPSIQLPNEGILMFSRHELSRWRIRLPQELKKKAVFVK